MSPGGALENNDLTRFIWEVALALSAIILPGRPAANRRTDLLRAKRARNALVSNVEEDLSIPSDRLRTVSVGLGVHKVPADRMRILCYLW